MLSPLSPRLLLLAAVLPLAACAQPAAPLPPPLTDALAQTDSLVAAAIAEAVIPGAVLLVGYQGAVVHEQAFGHALRNDYGPVPAAPPRLMTTATVFDLASLTKVFATTFALMRLVDDGRVDLDAPVHTYLPDFRGARKDSITVRHLLTHTSGLYPWKPLYYHADNAADTYAYIRALPLAYGVGAGRHYSDLGFMLLGYLVEAVSGQPLDVFLSETLYHPLSLRHTAFNPRRYGLGPFAATSHGNPFERRMVADDDFGYVCDEDPDAFQGWRTYVLDGEVNDGNAFHAHGGLAGHAGLFSTARDLHVLLNLLMYDGHHDGRAVFEPTTIEAFLTPGATGHGLGWAMTGGVLGPDALPPGTFGHTGFTGTYALGIPAHGLTLLLLTNRQNLGVSPDGTYPSVTPLRRAVAQTLLDAFPTTE